MNQLNNEQYRAVTHCDGPMLVVAGPGSGKTYVLVKHIEFLIKERKISPENILVLTFSKEAAYEMQSRFLSNDKEKSYPVCFGTFHSVFYYILRTEGKFESKEVLTLKKKKQLLSSVALKKGIRKYNDAGWLTTMLSIISLKKSGCIGSYKQLNESQQEDLNLIYDAYMQLCRNEEAIDFDDMIYECLQLLGSNSRIREKWQNRFKYILVDEFQDIDHNQYEILKLLAGEKRNLFCVGDDDQSIYSFRGAVPKLMFKFVEDNKNISIVKLTVNYRCTVNVIESSLKLIGKNKARFDKKIAPRMQAQKGRISCRCFIDRKSENSYCVEVIRKLLAENREVGVLYRNNRTGDLLEEYLKKEEISYGREGNGISYYDREYVKDIITYLQLSYKEDRDKYIRIMNKPERGLLREGFREGAFERGCVRDYFRYDKEATGKLEKLFRDIDFIKELNPYAAVNYILNGIEMRKYIKETYFGNLDGEEFEDVIKELFAHAENFGSVREWLEFVNAESSNEKAKERGNYKGLRLMTIHASKGLEFDNCIIIGLQEGLFPTKMSNTEELMEEERRLFYVALTRSRNDVWLIGRRRDNYGKRESRFISEAGIEVVI